MQLASGKPHPDPVPISAYVPNTQRDTDFLCLFHPYVYVAITLLK